MMDSDLPPGSCNSTGHLSTIGYHTMPGRMHHSASTPAGVDGAGGGSRTPPVTPKKSGKMLAVRIQMLDDSISMFQIQSKAIARVLFEQVCRQLHLLEADYFGLEYQDASSTRYWLDVEKPMCRQLGLSMLEPTLRFCVKFYTPDPARLEEEFTRYLFCLQVKRDLAHGCIQCNENTAALMASYIVQAECGDFVPEDYPDHTYLSGYKFFPGQDSESERRIMENHKKHIGQSPAEADMNLLETARRCELYGIKMHPAKDHDNVPLNLAVAHMGIVVFQHFTKINTFSWAKIRKISFKRKKFLIKLHPEGYGTYRDVVEFFFEARNECKNFWKKCVENHGFFRCSSVPNVARHRPRVISRGSSFRYSGKTQKQIVEFVRGNYLKRQTFQRAGSFLASRSRSAGGSRASVAAPPLNASVSAHPLLPLPPGSDAISLEWDKQPHYLEASLMMKGYSAGEAREAARRGGRALTEPRARPQLQATAYATTKDKLSKLYSSQIDAPELVTHAEVNHHPMEDSPPPHRMMTPSDSPENTWRRASMERAVNPGRARAPTPPPRAPRRPSAGPDELSPDDTENTENTVSSASLCVSPTPAERTQGEPLCASTPLARSVPNGHDVVDNKRTDVINGNVNVVVSESTYSMDVLSGGESDAGDTLRRQNNNNDSISSGLTAVLRDGTLDAKRRGADLTYFIAKELLMTERTYKRDLELVTVSWSRRVSELASSGVSSDVEDAGALARACLALEPLALACGALLARLDRMLAGSGNRHTKELASSGVSSDVEDAGALARACLALEPLALACGALLARLDRMLAGSGNRHTKDVEDAGALARACLALEPLALACGALLARLDRMLAGSGNRHTKDNEEPEYTKIAELLYEYLSSTFDAYAHYTSRAGTIVGLVESVRRRSAGGGACCGAFEASAPLPLACLLLRVPHRTHTLHAAARELYAATGNAASKQALELASRAALISNSQLAHVENHATLCQMQRDIVGYDKLLVADREFIRMGCVYKHSTRGLQQRMLFLFSDVVLVCSRLGGRAGLHRAHAALALRDLALNHSDLPHSFVLEGPETQLLISASNEHEYLGWTSTLTKALAAARELTTDVDTELTPYEQEPESVGCASISSTSSAGALTHVCWHRATSLDRQQMHLAMRTQLSGYLLRKFKKSPGWQKLWVVFALFTLFFYKNWQDDTPLASLPLLGYGVGAPDAEDGIDKDLVFKLQFKNHVYFFRADSLYTYNRWVEVLRTSMVQHDHS